MCCVEGGDCERGCGSASQCGDGDGPVPLGAFSKNFGGPGGRVFNFFLQPHQNNQVCTLAKYPATQLPYNSDIYNMA